VVLINPVLGCFFFMFGLGFPAARSKRMPGLQFGMIVTRRQETICKYCLKGRFILIILTFYRKNVNRPDSGRQNYGRREACIL